MINRTDFVKRVKALCGLPYDEVDCIGVLRNALGIRCAGTNWLWRSIDNSAKYRYLKLRVSDYPHIDELKPGDVVFKVNWEAVPDGYDGTPNCYHIGVYIGNGKVVHSSPSTGVREAILNEYEWDAWGSLTMVSDEPEYTKSNEQAEPTLDHEMTDHEMLKQIYQKIIGG